MLRRNSLLIIAFLIVGILTPSVARADCLSPAAVAGKIIYGDGNMQYCNGSNWVKFPKLDPITGWKQITAGTEWSSPFTCAIASDDSAWCWGTDDSGRLGNGAGVTSMQTTPSPVAGGYRWKQISAGAYHVCGIRTDGVAMCWGGDGALGNGDVWGPDQPAPVVVSGGYTWSKISAGGSSCGIRTDGVAMCWGFDSAGRMGNGAGGNGDVPGVVAGGYTWSDISAGNNHNCGVTTSGVGYCWGEASNGKLGNGTTTPNAQSPSLVLGGYTWQKISASGYLTTCGVTTAGVAYCWGEAGGGKLGNGTTTPDQSSPSLVLGGYTFQDVQSGTNAACGRTAANVVYCWGDNSWESTGTGASRTSPFILSGGHAWSSFAVGGSMGCGIRTNGTAMCWGRSDTGALGNGVINPDTSAVPVLVGNATKICTMGTWSGSAAAEANTWRSVAYGNGLFVAVSDDGTNRVMTSPDGVTWTARTTPGTSTWWSVTYGNGLFVAVSTGGTNSVMTSPDGINWTGRTGIGGQWQGLTYGNGLFVATAWFPEGGIMTSPDGINWTSRTAPTARKWISVTYGNGQFVAAAYQSPDGNNIMTSPDGINWTTRNSGTTPAGGNGWSGIAYGNGRYVAVATFELITSIDGINWSAPVLPGGTWGWGGIAYGNGIFAAVTGGTNTNMATSPDGINWTLVPTAAASGWNAITYGAGKFVSVAVNGTTRTMNTTCTNFCASPTEPEGSMVYNTDRRVMQWCDGVVWHSMGPDNPGGASGGCSNPTGTAGKMIYNGDYRVPQYCDGGTWRAVSGTCLPHDCGLVHHWKLDETTVTAGSQIRDSVGNAHGTVTGTLTSVAGKNGTAVYFDADNEYVGGIGVLPALNGQTKLTFSAWIKRNALSSGIFLGSYVSNTSGVYMDAWTGNSIYWGVGNAATGASDDEADYASNDTSWHLMTMVYDGSLTGNSNRLKAYLDGVAVVSSITGTIPATTNSTTAFQIGTLGGTYSRGTIDDVRIYNRALSPAEVLALYNATNGP